MGNENTEVELQEVKKSNILEGVKKYIDLPNVIQVGNDIFKTSQFVKLNSTRARADATQAVAEACSDISSAVKDSIEATSKRDIEISKDNNNATDIAIETLREKIKEGKSPEENKVYIDEVKGILTIQSDKQIKAYIAREKTKIAMALIFNAAACLVVSIIRKEPRKFKI